MYITNQYDIGTQSQNVVVLQEFLVNPNFPHRIRIQESQRSWTRIDLFTSQLVGRLMCSSSQLGIPSTSIPIFFSNKNTKFLEKKKYLHNGIGLRQGVPTYLFQDFTRKGRGYLPISNLFEVLLYTYRSKKSNAVIFFAFSK